MTAKHKKLNVCSNCGFNFKGEDNYCPSCGQKNHDLKIPIKHLLEEGVELFFHVDSKIFKTLKLLLFKPGILSKEYNEGKRVKYIPPVRLYVLISFVFFLLINFSLPKEDSQKKSSPITVTFYGINARELSGLTIAQADSLFNSRIADTSRYTKFWFNQLYKIGNSSLQEFVHSLLKNISYMMFVLMPGFAFLLFLLFKQSSKYYLESLIVSLHLHSFIFILLSFIILVGRTITIFAVALTPILVLIYLYFTLRRSYSQKIFTTLWKSVTIGVLHLVLFIILFMGTVFVSVYLV